MAESELALLRGLLQQERAAREEHEHALTAQTRQLWQLRDKHEKEVKQLSDQLSVVRASLILAHRAQLAHKASRAHGSPAKSQQLQVAIAQDTDIPGVDVAADSPKKRKQITDQVHRAKDAKDGNPTPSPKAPAAAALEAHSKQQVVTAEQDAASAEDTAVATKPNLSGDCQAFSPREEPAAGNSIAPETTTSSSSSSSHIDTASASAVLLAATAKLQQLVEQLTQHEPAVAADLSLLQWQLTTAYGSLSGAPCGRSSSAMETSLTVPAGPACGATTSSSNDNSSGSGNSNSNDEADDQQQTAADSTGSEQQQQQQQQPVTPGAVKPQPTDVHPLKVTDSSSDQAPATPTAAAAASAAGQHSEADVAAAARLFSGAASTLQAPQLDWYYIEHGSSIRGPHDPALMIRWHCSWFLEDNLPVAGMLQDADGSSSAPPAAAFQPLRQLLELVQQGGKYTPCAAAQLHVSQEYGSSPLPALPVSTHSSCWSGHQQQQQQQQQPQDLAGLDLASPIGGAADAQKPADTLDSNSSSSSSADERAECNRQQEQQQQQEEKQGYSSISSQGWSIKAVQDALDTVGNAVEEMVINGLTGTASGSPIGEGEGTGSALDFVSDFPQLFPAAVMSGVVQRHSAGGAPGQLQPPAAAAAATAAAVAAVAPAGGMEAQPAAAAAAASTNSGKFTGEKKADGGAEGPATGAATAGGLEPVSDFATEAARRVGSVLPGVWRVESLWRADSPNTAATIKRNQA